MVIKIIAAEITFNEDSNIAYVTPKNNICFKTYSFIKIFEKLEMILTMYMPQQGACATQTKTHAIFGYGVNYISGDITYNDRIDAYDNNLTHTTGVIIEEARIRRSVSAATCGDYAMFAGGSYGSSSQPNRSYCEYYDSLLTMSLANLSRARSSPAAASLDKHMFFAGGDGYGSLYDYGNCVDVFTLDQGLTRTTLTNLTTAKQGMASATIKDAAIFAGGRYIVSAQTKYYTTVESYNINTFAKKSLSSLSGANNSIGGASLPGYALFAGGTSYSNSNYTYYDSVTVYNDSGTKITGTTISRKVSSIKGITAGSYALLVGGYATSGADAIIEVFDRNLLRFNIDPLSAGQSSVGLAMINNYILVGGGRIKSGYSDEIQVYKKN